MGKKHITVIINDKMGGVPSVFINLIEYTKTDFDYFFLLLHKKEDNQAGISKFLDTKKLNYKKLIYSEIENKYSVIGRIVRLIKKDTIVIANDFLELEAFCVMKLPNKLIKYVHGTFESEFEIVAKYHPILDGIICVSDFIQKKSATLLPESSKQKVVYLKHVMPNIAPKNIKKDNSILNLIYIGRFIKGKGADDLIQIENQLALANLTVHWTFVTNGLDEHHFKERLLDKSKTIFYNNIPADQIFSLLSQSDLFVFPSYYEGFPLAVIEAMQCGAVPIVYNIESGIPEIVIGGETGYKFEVGNVQSMTKKIIELYNDREKIKELSNNSKTYISKYFNPEFEAKQFSSFIIQCIETDTPKQFLSNCFRKKSGLDKWFLPNIIVILIRTIKNNAKKFHRRKLRVFNWN